MFSQYYVIINESHQLLHSMDINQNKSEPRINVEFKNTNLNNIDDSYLFYINKKIEDSIDSITNINTKKCINGGENNSNNGDSNNNLNNNKSNNNNLNNDNLYNSYDSYAPYTSYNTHNTHNTHNTDNLGNNLVGGKF